MLGKEIDNIKFVLWEICKRDGRQDKERDPQICTQKVASDEYFLLFIVPKNKNRKEKETNNYNKNNNNKFKNLFIMFVPICHAHCLHKQAFIWHVRYSLLFYAFVIII